MAKKKPKSVQNKKTNINPNPKLPNRTLKSRGSFWVNKRESGKWRVLFQNWSEGKKQKPETISKSMYRFMGLTLEMTAEQAKQAIHEYNKIRKKDIRITQSQIRALKRHEEMKEYDKLLFPPSLVEEFVNRLMSVSEGKKKHKQRLIRCFGIVQEMIVELNLLPQDYEPNLDKIISYFKAKERKYSASYSKNILWVLNHWGHFYSRNRRTFFEPIGRLRVKTQNAISTIQKEKDGVRRTSLPMTADLLKKLRSKIDTDKLQELNKYHWVFISFVFGLRPSECDLRPWPEARRIDP